MRVAELVLLLLSACKPHAEPRLPISTPPQAAGSAPSFKRDVLPVLQKNCSNVEGCHGNDPTLSVDLDLRPEAAWVQLVKHPADSRPGALLVDPGHPESSFLLSKLTGALGADEGKAMPLDANTGVSLEPSPVAPWVEAVLKPWIQAGALND